MMEARQENHLRAKRIAIFNLLLAISINLFPNYLCALTCEVQTTSKAAAYLRFFSLKREATVP